MDPKVEAAKERYRECLARCRAFGREPETDPEFRKADRLLAEAIENSHADVRFGKRALACIITAISIAIAIYLIQSLVQLLRTFGL